MKRLLLVLAAAVLGSACATDSPHASDDRPYDSEASGLSGMSLSLTGTDTQGRPYRLRNATFTVDPAYYYYGNDGGAPPASTVLSTETDPDATSLSVRLVPGQYAVTLGGSWYIERLTASGPEHVAQVVLLNEQTQYTYISQDWNYSLAFRFGVDGTLIDFRHGDLTIDIAIELPGDHTSDGGDFGYDASRPVVIYPTSTADAGWPF